MPECRSAVLYASTFIDKYYHFVIFVFDCFIFASNHFPDNLVSVLFQFLSFFVLVLVFVNNFY